MVTKADEVVGIDEVSQLLDVDTVDELTLDDHRVELAHPTEGYRVVDGHLSVCAHLWRVRSLGISYTVVPLYPPVQ